jgi:uncharacterized protein
MTVQLVVLAKAPRPGRVKTRLCPPCTPENAARIAAAALTDTVAAVTATPAARRTLVVDGAYPAPTGWVARPQRGDDLGERLAHAFTDTALPGVPTLLIGMDTPQVTPAGLTSAAAALADVDAVLGLAADGGWWALGLRDPVHAAVLPGVPMSTGHTGARTRAALLALGLRIAPLPEMRDVDTAADAWAVAGQCAAGSRFAAVVPALMVAA